MNSNVLFKTLKIWVLLYLSLFFFFLTNEVGELWLHGSNEYFL